MRNDPFFGFVFGNGWGGGSAMGNNRGWWHFKKNIDLWGGGDREVNIKTTIKINFKSVYVCESYLDVAIDL